MMQKLQITISVSDPVFNNLVNNIITENSRNNSEFKWMKTVMSKGTVSDKIAASTIAIQDNPVCTLDTLQNLINMVKVGKKKECVIAIGKYFL